MTGSERDDYDDEPLPRPKPGDVLASKYRVEKVIGEGGMGVVFAAHHLVLHQMVAVKVLHSHERGGDVVVARFQRETQAAARMQSEHVARVMDAGSLENGAPFLAMEYLEGCDLEALVKLDGPLHIEEAVDCIIQALAAIAEAHSLGIIHRDLKPSNLFLSVRPDGSNIVKVLDFGISKHHSASIADKELTGHAVLGTPTYMAPEQLRNASSVDSRADIWSLGVVLYVLLTGHPPFDGDGVGEIFAAILEQDAPLLRAKRPDAPEGLEQVIARALRRNVNDRWTDAAEFARALSPFGSGQWAHLISATEQMVARAKAIKETGVAPMSMPRVRTVAPNTATVTLSEQALARLTAPTPFAAYEPAPLPTSSGASEMAVAQPASLRALVQKRSTLWIASGLALVLLGIIVLALSRTATRTNAAATPDAPPSALATSPANDVHPAESAAPSTSASAEAEPAASASSVANDSHPASSARPHARDARPQSSAPRPSFLNSRK